eukprot:Hpha_TRINITY_DN6959_c0_g1::TRINITY_DN6959_c0_g1_i1::g.139502::m.139502
MYSQAEPETSDREDDRQESGYDSGDECEDLRQFRQQMETVRQGSVDADALQDVMGTMLTRVRHSEANLINAAELGSSLARKLAEKEEEIQELRLQTSPDVPEDKPTLGDHRAVSQRLVTTRRDLESVEHRLNITLQELDESRQTIEKLKRGEETMRVREKSLAAEVAHWQEREGNAPQLERHVEAIETQLKEETRQRKAAESEVSLLNGEVGDLRRELDEQESVVAAERRKLERRHEEEIEEVQSRAQQQQAALGEEIRSLEREARTHDARVEQAIMEGERRGRMGVQKQLREREEALEEADARAADTEHQCAVARKQGLQWNIRRHEASEEASRMRLVAECTEYKCTTQSSLTHFITDHASRCRAEVEAAQRQRAEAEEGLRADLARQEALLEGAEKEKQRLELLLSERDEVRRAELQRAEAAASDGETLRNELSETSARCVSLEQEKAALERDLTETRGRLDAEAAAQHGLSEQLAIAARERAQGERTRISEKARFESELAAAREEVSLLTTKLDASSQSTTAAAAQAGERQRELEDIQRQLEESQGALASVQQKADEAEKGLREARAALDESLGEAERQGQSQVELKKQLTASNAMLTLLREQLTSAQGEKERLHKDIEQQVADSARVLLVEREEAVRVQGQDRANSDWKIIMALESGASAALREATKLSAVEAERDALATQIETMRGEAT